MNDLDTLVPQGIELVIDGEPLVIKPLKVGQLPGFLRAISPVMQQISSTEIDWLALFGERGDDLLSAIAIAVLESSATLPDAPPGPAFRPLAIGFALPTFLILGLSSCSRASGGTRVSASSLVIRPSFTISTAIFTAALEVLLPVRVWSR